VVKTGRRDGEMNFGQEFDDDDAGGCDEHEANSPADLPLASQSALVPGLDQTLFARRAMPPKKRYRPVRAHRSALGINHVFAKSQAPPAALTSRPLSQR
jgi:hypothetical protein